MNDKKDAGGLPPLPAPDRSMWQYGKQIDHYTAEQMREYAKAVLASLGQHAKE
jgi:hypothetical protein